MGVMSWIHWLIILATVTLLGVAFVWPAVRILQRAGFSPWWSLLGLIPGGPFVGYLLLAFVPWPALERGPTGAEADR
jgi:hypothetical protein